MKAIPNKWKARVEKTISCRDCNYIPKVLNAGQVIEQDDEKYQIMHNGLKIHYGCYHGDWMAYIINTLKGHHEPQEEKVFHEVLKHINPGATMLELGAFWAYYSLWFRKAILDSTSYLIEPNINKLAIGKKNFTLNEKIGDFTNAFIGSQSNPHATFVDWDKTTSKIPCIAIDDFLEQKQISYLDILHSDIQGAEVDMLKGAMKSLKNNKIGYLFISTHGNCHQKCLDILRQLNYHVVCQHTIAQSVSADGLIVASNPTITPRLDVHVST
jgi:FkbM family methyltransferase